MTLNIIYDLHNVINLSVDVSQVLVLSHYSVNNKICLKQNLYYTLLYFIIQWEMLAHYLISMTDESIIWDAHVPQLNSSIACRISHYVN